MEANQIMQFTITLFVNKQDAGYSSLKVQKVKKLIFIKWPVDLFCFDMETYSCISKPTTVYGIGGYNLKI